MTPPRIETTTFAPMGIVALHSRLVRGIAEGVRKIDRSEAKSGPIFHFKLDEDDQIRWPDLHNVEEVYLLYDGGTVCR